MKKIYLTFSLLILFFCGMNFTPDHKNPSEVLPVIKAGFYAGTQEFSARAVELHRVALDFQAGESDPLAPSLPTPRSLKSVDFMRDRLPVSDRFSYLLFSPSRRYSYASQNYKNYKKKNSEPTFGNYFADVEAAAFGFAVFKLRAAEVDAFFCFLGMKKSRGRGALGFCCLRCFRQSQQVGDLNTRSYNFYKN